MDAILLLGAFVGLVVALVGLVLLIVDIVKKAPQKVSRWVLGVGVGLFVLTFSGFYLVAQHEANVAAAQRAAKQRKTKQMNKRFKDADTTVVMEGVAASMAAEKIGNQYLSVWYDAIWDDAGVTVDGETYTDFSDAVNAQETAYENDSTTSDLQDTQAKMNAAFETMTRNKTKKNAALYQKAKRQVAAVNKFVRLATDPSGSYSDYSDDLHDADSTTSDSLTGA